MTNDTPEIAAIKATMAERGFTQADAARVLGLDSSQMTRTFKGSRRLQIHEARKLREWLGMEATSSVSGGPVMGSVSVMPGLVPLYGWVGASSAERLTLADENLLGAVPMHPLQANVREPFALQVQDESMTPRYEPGEVIYLAPNRWPARGKYLVLETNDGNGLLKQFLRRETDRVILRQFNPDQELVILNDNIRAVHTVIGAG